MSTANGSPPGNRTVLLILPGVVIVALAFALLGQQAWEDYWITFRSSRHLVEGHGLVFQIGERVHTFTSPLGVLLPALGLKLTGNDLGALWFMRLLSIGALGGAAGLLLRRLEAGTLVAVATICVALLDSKTVQFATNGMETGLMVFFVALVWHEIANPHLNRWWPLAAGFSGLLWTRPDSVVPAVAIFAGCALFLHPGKTVRERWPWARHILFAALAGGVVYAPWFFWAWDYYGFPVPNTIIAKSAIIVGDHSAARVLLAPLTGLIDPTMFDGTFAPTYFRIEDWPQMLALLWRLLARVAAFGWLLPGVPRQARAASFATMIGCVFFQQITVFSWYFAPWTLLGGIAIGGMAQSALIATRAGQPGLRIALALLALVTLGTTIATIQTARIQNRWIEENGRKAIGLWLREHAGARDTVFVEPLGYIGYYSGLKMLDYPGLCAPEVTRLIRAGSRSYGDLISTLRPDWVVLRPIEIVNNRLQENGVLRPYELVRAWDQQAQLDATPYLPGRSSMEYDALFLLFRRRTDTRLAP